MSDNFLFSVETDGEFTNEVTAEDLNNIAVDLGVADYAGFSDGEPYAVSKLNEITQALTTKGILRIGNECAVTLTDGNIHVADGVCVFNTGAKKRINEEDDVSAAYIPGHINYVYFLNNEFDNKIQLVVSTEAPLDASDHLMLAEIDAAGKVTDRRYWSRSKTSNGINKVFEETVTIIFPKKGQEHNICEYNINGYGTTFFISKDYTAYDSDDRERIIARPLKDNETILMYWRNEDVLKITLNGSLLTLEAYRSSGSIDSTHTITFWVV